jgi:hypothetical protein
MSEAASVVFQFVAHPNIQQLLAALWYDGLPGFRRMPLVQKLYEICKIALLFPFYCTLYMIAPNTQTGQLMRKPFMKFLIHASSYLFFLCESSAQTNHTYTKPHQIIFLIVPFIPTSTVANFVKYQPLMCKRPTYKTGMLSNVGSSYSLVTHEKDFLTLKASPQGWSKFECNSYKNKNILFSPIKTSTKYENFFFHNETYGRFIMFHEHMEMKHMFMFHFHMNMKHMEDSFD